MAIKVLAFTSIRSDYELMSLVYKGMQKNAGFDLKLIVSGAHLSHQYGMTVRDIYSDGFDILVELETLISGDSRSSRLKTAANFLISVIDHVRVFAPDLLLFSGDREDALMISMLGAYLDIPTIHYFAGEHSLDGYVDNPVRHASSKLASAFFVSTHEHARRLISIGESAERIFVIGSVALDKFLSEPYLSRDELQISLNLKPLSKSRPWVIVIFHPIMEEVHLLKNRILSCVNSLVDYGYYVMIGAPNSDPGHHVVFEAIDEVKSMDCVSYYGNVSRNVFVNVMRHSVMMIGNSSAGIIEAASIPIPVINVGLRQKGRFAGENVFFVDDEQGMSTLLANEVSSRSLTRASSNVTINPYGDGKSVGRALQIMRNFDFFSIIHKHEDPLSVGVSFAGRFAFDFMCDKDFEC